MAPEAVPRQPQQRARLFHRSACLVGLDREAAQEAFADFATLTIGYLPANGVLKPGIAQVQGKSAFRPSTKPLFP